MGRGDRGSHCRGQPVPRSEPRSPARRDRPAEDAGGRVRGRIRIRSGRERLARRVDDELRARTAQSGDHAGADDAAQGPGDGGYAAHYRCRGLASGSLPAMRKGVQEARTLQLPYERERFLP